jgi:hypothetical protein
VGNLHYKAHVYQGALVSSTCSESFQLGKPACDSGVITSNESDYSITESHRFARLNSVSTARRGSATVRRNRPGGLSATKSCVQTGLGEGYGSVPATSVAAHKGGPLA